MKLPNSSAQIDTLVTSQASTWFSDVSEQRMADFKAYSDSTLESDELIAKLSVIMALCRSSEAIALNCFDFGFILGMLFATSGNVEAPADDSKCEGLLSTSDLAEIEELFKKSKGN